MSNSAEFTSFGRRGMQGVEPLVAKKPKKTSRSKRAPLMGRYQVETELGQGAAAQVFLAQDLKNPEQRVALKLLKIKKGTDPALIDSLKNEFATLTLLHHQHLAQVFDFGIYEDQLYLTTEFIDGKDLLTATQGTNFNTIFQLMLQVLRGVDYLHRRGVLHLDLKPENILVTDPNRTGQLTAKLIDFGLAVGKASLKPSSEEFSGTPPYAAPEVLMGQAASPASDLYSLGILFHQIFTGKYPFVEQEPMAIFNEQIYRHEIKIHPLPAALPKGMEKILGKLIQKEPQDRYRSPSKFLEALNKVIGETYSLRNPTAPTHILEETDYAFRPELLEDLVATYQNKPKTMTWLQGESGSGKSRMLRRVKERLQIQGNHPLFFTQGENLERFLKNNPQHDEVLILDYEQVDKKTVDSLNKNGFSTLLATTPDQIPRGLKVRVQALSPLTHQDLQSFFSHEIAKFPAKEINNWVARCGSTPAALEKFLQALKEERLIQWTDQGWKWVATGEINWGEIMPRYRKLYQERLQQIQDILGFSTTGLTAANLEGMLGMEKGGLAQALQEWEKAKQIKAQEKDGKKIYFGSTSWEEQTLPQLKQEWDWTLQKLQGLYRRNQFERGVQWVEFLQEKSTEALPIKVRLIAARHLAAAGYPQRALDFLSDPPNEPEDIGMYHEIRCRASLSLRKMDPANSSLNQAMIAYQQAKDHSGMARILNLNALLLKGQGKHPQAEDLMKKAIQEAHQGKDPTLEANLWMNLANLFHNRGRFEEAEQSYQKGLELSKDQEYTLLTSTLQHNWVNFLYHLGYSQRAEEACYHWLREAIRHHHLEQQAAAFNYLALLADQKNNREEQLSYLNQAIGILQSLPALKSPHLLPQFFLNRGFLHLDLGNFLPAQLDAEAAFDLLQKMTHPFLYASALLLLGKVHRDREIPDYSAASEYLSEAEKVIHEHQHRPLLWEVEFERGILEKMQQQREAAKRHLEKSQEALELLLKEMPKAYQKNYLRDRKMEKINRELQELS